MSSDTTQLVTFVLDRRLFALEVEHVQEVLRPQVMTRVPLAARGVRGLVNLRGEILTAFDLRTRLGLPPATMETSTKIVVRRDDRPVALLVDDVRDVMEIPTRRIERPPITLTGPISRFVRGVVRLERELVLLLDPERTCEVDDPRSERIDSDIATNSRWSGARW
jgi:purine-binding chemotaxis protein CheW